MPGNPAIITRMKRTLFLLLAGLLAALHLAGAAESKIGKPTGGKAKAGATVALGVQWLAGMADPRIDESSGVAVSRRDPNVLWTHNDGGVGKKPRLFSIDRAGKTLAVFSIGGTSLHDWEDIATDGAGHLYLGDIGNARGNSAFRVRLSTARRSLSGKSTVTSSRK